MYHFYLGGLHLPVAPSELTVKVGSQNRTISLVDGREINILKSPGLQEISFKVLLPNEEYYFANYMGNFISANEIMNRIITYKNEKQPFQFVVSRSRGNKFLFFTDIRVALEEVAFSESFDEGFDMLMQVKLKEYVDYGTQIYTLNEDNTLCQINIRQTDNKPAAKSYTVKKGDCLWSIAKTYYGDGSRYMDIYNANKDIISNPRLINTGAVLVIPQEIHKLTVREVLYGY